MASELFKPDLGGRTTVVGGVSNDANLDPTMFRVDPTTKGMVVYIGGSAAAGDSVNIAQVNGVAVNVGTGAAGTGTMRVAVASDSSLVLAAGSATIGALTANQSVNNTQINGVTITTGSGVSGTGVQRFALASDANTVDTELPAAATIAADAVTPTVPGLAAYSFLKTPGANTWDRMYSVVNSTDSTGIGINAVGLLAQYDDTSPSIVTENQFANLRMTSTRFMKVSQGDLISGEDQTNNVIRVEGQFTRASMTTATTTTHKSGSGLLHSVVINKAVAAGVVTMYDNTAGSGTVIGTITFGAALLTDPPLLAIYDINFSTGFTVVTSAATDITFSYR